MQQLGDYEVESLVEFWDLVLKTKGDHWVWLGDHGSNSRRGAFWIRLRGGSVIERSALGLALQLTRTDGVGWVNIGRRRRCSTPGCINPEHGG